MKHFAVGIVIGLVLSTSVLASPTGSSIGFNFAADEPNGGFEAEVAGAAGAVGTVNWNNLEGQTDIFDEVVMDGVVVPTTYSDRILQMLYAMDDTDTIEGIITENPLKEPRNTNQPKEMIE